MSAFNMRAARTLACSAFLLLVNLAASSPAWADAPGPLYQYYGMGKTQEEKNQFTFPPQPFEGPCGLAVDSKGNFYVADYYHQVVDAISSARKYLTQAAKVSPSDGPCGLAVDGSGALYVNEYHAGVVKYLPSAFPLTASTTYGPPTTVVEADVTGIAVDPVSGRLYVNQRTRILAYEPSGAPVLDAGGQPIEIGVGSLSDGYGLAFSRF